MVMLWRRGMLALVAGLAATGALILAFAVSTRPGHTRTTTPVSAFQALAPAPAPAGWSSLPLPDGTAVLSYPSALRRVISDSDAVSAARLGPGGAYLLYLNATPAGRREPPQLGRVPAVRAARRGRVGGTRGRHSHRAGVPGRHRFVRDR